MIVFKPDSLLGRLFIRICLLSSSTLFGIVRVFELPLLHAESVDVGLDLIELLGPERELPLFAPLLSGRRPYNLRNTEETVERASELGLASYVVEINLLVGTVRSGFVGVPLEWSVVEELLSDLDLCSVVSLYDLE